MSSRDVVDFDHHDQSFAEDPYRVYRGLQSCPVAYSEAWGGFWIVSSYAAVSEVAHDDETFCSGQGVTLPTVGNMRPLIPLEVDPPEFQRYRRLLNPLFSPAAVERQREDIEVITDRLIDAFIEGGRCDLVEEFTHPLPAIVTMRLLGVGDERWREFLESMHVVIHDSASDLDRAIESALEVYAMCAEAIDEKRDAGAGGNPDVISYLLSGGGEGAPLSDEEILDVCFLVLGGGLDTTSAAIANAIRYLGANRAARDRLIERSDLIPSAVEEFLRFEAPVQGLARTATRDTVLGGQDVRAGDKLWVLWAAANRDPAAFDDPDSVILDRNPNRHLAFGVGIHRCLGSHLGRLMFQTALAKLLERIPDYQVVEDEVRRVGDCSVAFGLRSLPLVFPSGTPLNSNQAREAR